MAAKDDDKHPGKPGGSQPQGKREGDAPTYTAGQGAQQNPVKHQEPPKGQSQKGQIAQYFKSQGRQPDDEVMNVNGLSLKLSDLE